MIRPGTLGFQLDGRVKRAEPPSLLNKEMLSSADGKSGWSPVLSHLAARHPAERHLRDRPLVAGSTVADWAQDSLGAASRSVARDE